MDDKQIVVITGGTKGIGKALYDYFTQKGFTAIALSRNTEEDDTHFKCDVTDSDQVITVFNRIIERFNHIDILINNVGMGLGGAIEFLSYEWLDNQVKTNLMSAVYCTKAVLERTSPTQPLKIINISSIGAFGVQPFRTMYSVTKSAVNMFTVGMRQELHGSNVKMCSISLGDTQTDFGKHHPNDFRTSPRYGDRIQKSDDTSAKRSESNSKDKRMPVDKAAKKIFNVVMKKKYKAPTYCIGFKYKFLHLLSRFFTTEQISEIVRKMFE